MRNELKAYRLLFPHTILPPEDKTSKNEVNTCCPYPHPEILEVPHAYGQYSADIVPDRDEVRERFLCEWLEPCFLKATRIRCRIDRDHNNEDISIVRFQSPEYNQSDS
jgi:hypothetical protein